MAGGEARTLAAGVVVVRPADGGGHRFLALRAYRYWDFPKGEVEPGEDPATTARREVAEETGLSDLDFRWGPVHYETEPYRGGAKVARYYVAESTTGEVSLPVAPDLGRPEHHEHRWVDAEEARRLLGPRVRGALDWAESLIAGDSGTSAHPG